MITIVHGSDTASSRKFYIDQRSNSLSYVLIDKISYDNIFQAIEGNSLFENSKQFYIENFFTNVKTNSNDFKKIVEYINATKADILIWEGKELSRPQQFIFKNAQIKSFNYPTSLFTFLDSLKPGNNSTVELFKELEKTMEVELIFYMIIRQFRMLLYFLDPKYTIEEAKSVQPWLKSKLINQASFFGKETLIKHYKNFYRIDYQTKFGLTPFSLSASIDILLSDL